MLHTLAWIATFIGLFAVLVFFHELGHFLFAKLFRMRVEEFALGMGLPKLRLFSDGETEYTLRAVPIGGFVRIAGMDLEDSYESKLTGAEARPVEAETPVAPDPHGFNSRPIYQRFLVILAGPAFSILLAYLSFCLYWGVFGIPDGPVTNRVHSVMVGSAAADAGIHPGDSILAIDGKETKAGEDVIAQIHAANGKPVTVTIQHPDGSLAAPMTLTPRPIKGDFDATPLLGVDMTTKNRRPVGVGEAISLGGQSMSSTLSLMWKVLASGHVKDAVGGPVAIAKQVSAASDTGPDMVLLILAQLSLSLGIFNLFPIPVLDGGHLVLMVLEFLRRRKLSAEQTQRVFATGLAVLGLLFVYVMVKDIFLS